MKILVTGAGSLCGQGIIRCLQNEKEFAEIVAVDPSPYAVGLHWADKAYVVPLVARGKDYIDRMWEIFKLEAPDLIMVGTDVELVPLVAQCGMPVLASINAVRIADDKWLTYQWLMENGFNPPRTALLRDLGKLVQDVKFPLIVKPRIGSRSRGVRVVEWWGHVDQLMKEVDPNADTYIAQERIVGFEYTAGSVTFPGEEVATIVMRRELRDGNTETAFVEGYGFFNEFVRSVSLKLQPFGPCNFQFRNDANGMPRIFEINARFSGTTPFRAFAGFHEVSMCVDHLLDGKTISQPELKPITIKRHWSESVLDKVEIFGEENADSNNAA